MNFDVTREIVHNQWVGTPTELKDPIQLPPMDGSEVASTSVIPCVG